MSQRRNNSIDDQSREEVNQKKNEMKRRLENLDMYEDGMSAEDMEKCLDFIDESKNANATINLSADSKLHAGVINSLPSSSTVDNQKTQTSSFSKIDNKSTSLETSTGNINKQSQSKDNNLMNEGNLSAPKTLSVNSNVADSGGAKKNNEMLNSKCSSSSSASPSRTPNAHVRRNENSQEKKPSYFPHRQSKSLDNMNILNCKTSPNDVPLTSRFVAKPQSKFSIIDKVIMVPDEVLAKNNAYLTEIANLAQSWKTQLTCNEFSWGPPIKVGTANRSLDTITSKEEIPNDPEISTRPITREMGATCYSLRSMDKKNETYEYDDSDEDIFDRKKQKIKPNILSNRSVESLKQSQSKIQTYETSEEVNSKSELEVVRSDDDDKETINSPSSRKKARSATPEYPDQSYPRRIVPPNPSTTKSKKKIPVSSSRPKKRNATSDDSGNKSTKTPSGLNEKEIEASLMTSEEDVKFINCTSPPTKRVNQSIEYLKKAKKKTEEKKQKHEEEVKLLAEREAQEKMEKAKKRIKEREENNLQLAAQVKSEKEREDRYRNLMNTTKSQGSITRKYQKRIELESEGLRSRTIHFSNEPTETESMASQNSEDNDMFADNEYETANSVQAVESSECPICRKSFSLTEIENHAANCDDFVEDKPRQNNNINLNASTSNNAFQSSKYRCEVCKFVTQNSDIYKEHFAICIQSLTDEGNESTQVASSNHSSDDSMSLNPDSSLEKKGKQQPLLVTNKKKHPGPSSRKRKR
ncbi:hypothetical protein PV325_004100 [Microctonus aethiopoides]|nr:hypothetical protein PV325_004100 [Microctonus aethiopoides]